MSEPFQHLRFSVPPEQAGVRLDKFLADVAVELSRTRIKALVLGGQVQVRGNVCDSPAYKLKSGDEIRIDVPAPREDTPLPENIPLDIVYEDDALIVINKPVGLVVHAGAGHEDGTLVNALLHHCGDTLSGIGGVKRPGIVHRLDKDTSGLMLAAKTDRAHQALSAQLSDRSLHRLYKALVWGAPVPRKGIVDAPIGRHPSHRQKMAVVQRNGREARTQYLVAEEWGPAALVECSLETGRTHQVRVHMAHLGHPLLGDPLYGLARNGQMSRLRKAGLGENECALIVDFPRQALHAAEIAFIHPLTGEEMGFESPIPEDMAGIINVLNQIDK
ncbi:MAG: RluA family pseudouridine synthase [Micavibrio aeruginosavorus]|uniref:Pseudouridine synthase n=1 Tax=Micavibrio aeruginosavorus TaxID=349221 RepID=A0A7T5R3Y1_9BACT|nr:MAG: RluA family pseudouridine synthase [Micavibrio aeruginosavorus]